MYILNKFIELYKEAKLILSKPLVPHGKLCEALTGHEYTLLTETESNHIKEKLKHKWGIGKSYYWYPLADLSSELKNPSVTISLHLSAFLNKVDKLQLAEVLSSISPHGIYEFSELDPPKKTVVHVGTVGQDSELYICESNLNWVIYISHEDTITFSGPTLVNAIKSLLSEWKKTDVFTSHSMFKDNKNWHNMNYSKDQNYPDYYKLQFDSLQVSSESILLLLNFKLNKNTSALKIKIPISTADFKSISNATSKAYFDNYEKSHQTFYITRPVKWGNHQTKNYTTMLYCEYKGLRTKIEIDCSELLATNIQWLYAEVQSTVQLDYIKA